MYKRPIMNGISPTVSPQKIASGMTTVLPPTHTRSSSNVSYDAMSMGSWGTNTVLTSMTSLVRDPQSGRIVCPKHPDQVFENLNEPCRFCEAEIQKQITDLHERRDSVAYQIQQLENSNNNSSGNNNNPANATKSFTHIEQQPQQERRPMTMINNPAAMASEITSSSNSGSGVSATIKSSSNAAAGQANSAGNPSMTQMHAQPPPPQIPTINHYPFPPQPQHHHFNPQPPHVPAWTQNPPAFFHPHASASASAMASSSHPPALPNSASNSGSSDALAAQMQRLQNLQDWMLYQKEQECNELRKLNNDYISQIQQLRVENALLTEKLHQQEQRMQQELKLIKLAALQKQQQRKLMQQQQQQQQFQPTNHRSMVLANPQSRRSHLEDYSLSRQFRDSYENEYPSMNSSSNNNNNNDHHHLPHPGNMANHHENISPLSSPFPHNQRNISSSNSYQTGSIPEPPPTWKTNINHSHNIDASNALVMAGMSSVEVVDGPPNSSVLSDFDDDIQDDYHKDDEDEEEDVDDDGDEDVSRDPYSTNNTNKPILIPPTPAPSVSAATVASNNSSDTTTTRNVTSPQRTDSEKPGTTASTFTTASILETAKAVARTSLNHDNISMHVHPAVENASNTIPREQTLSQGDRKEVISSGSKALLNSSIDNKSQQERKIEGKTDLKSTATILDNEVDNWTNNLADDRGQQQKSKPAVAPTASTSFFPQKKNFTQNRHPPHLPPKPPQPPSSHQHYHSTSTAKGVSWTDDNASVGQSVASSTFGEDRQKVENQVILDPYGDKGNYTGVILRSTGMPHGAGTMIYQEDNRTYDGEWRHGRWHGFGRATFANGDSYEGEYRFDQRHGKGRYEWHDGRIYDGMFREDKRHGKGKFIWPDGAAYEGEFRNGQRDGQGVYKFSDGGRYEGSWKDGRYSGYGICSWEDGRCYKGEWLNGMAHGKGVETYPDGSIRHDGLWVEDEPVLN